MTMKIFLMLILSGAWVVSAHAQQMCFRNEGLKENHIVRFEIDGNSFAGSYLIEPYDEPENARTFNFTGTKKGGLLTVRFADKIPPGVAVSKTKSLIWTLDKTIDDDILFINFYGKNYETNKNAFYSAEFLPCEPSYAALTKRAKRIAFAKGATSSTHIVSFENRTQRKTFWLGVRKNQSISVVSPGCGISFYRPDKTVYEEGKAIDTLTTENVQQTGDYLFVISPAGEPGECSTTFKITD